MPKRRPSKLEARGQQLEAVLARCRLDANAAHARYDDSDGFVVYAEGGAVKQVRYVFRSLEDAYKAAASSFSLRRHKYFD